MRDVLIAGIVLSAALTALRRPWIGVLLWAWLSLMNPHRYAYGFSVTGQWAMIAALATLGGLLLTTEKGLPTRAAPAIWLLLLTIWISGSWAMGLDPDSDYDHWMKVIKVNAMTLVALIALRTKAHIVSFAAVCAGSLALLGAKGGLFTLTGGGEARVYGPPGSFIADNNEFALALVMTIPLLRFLQMQISRSWGRHVLTVTMILCAVSALGSHSRGGLVAIAAMFGLFWWRGKRKFKGGIALVAIGIALLAFMPDSWFARMETIQTYEKDTSAMGRISAWWVAWRVALDFPFGVGFDIARPELFAKYSPYPDLGVFVAHSIYFQILGNHGFVGLVLFLLTWTFTWRSASMLRAEAARVPHAQWCADLSSMCQVALLGYFVGGAFLNLAYFDLPYFLLVLVVVTRDWLWRETARGAAVGGTPAATQ